MAEPPAVNASPLIFLARAGLVDILQLVAPEIVVPREVALEIGRRGSDDPAARVIATTDWIEVVETPSAPSIIHSWDLGPGESSVLAWCAPDWINVT